MASSSYSRKSYHVFLSFRGPDVRNIFLGHLYMALDQSGIYTYVDSKELRKGEHITPELMKAIEDSRIAVIIFSKNYASSSWCLDELTKIMECKKQKDLIVLPLFYKVEPREVRTPRGVYKEAMAKHEEKFGKEYERVKRWNEALLEVGSLSGWEFSDGDDEARLIQNIVQQISTQLDRMPLYVVKYPVGIDSQVEELKQMLNLQSNDDVLMIGLWGQGGVGKTTLAKAIYNVVFREFQGSSFLERVRENSKDLVQLQEKLLSEVLLGKKLTVFGVAGGSQLIQERLCNKKVLIILDDVDDEFQLNALVGDSDWFAKGSRIIITTRNKHLLNCQGVNHVYEVNALKDREALELFRNHAFPRNRRIEIKSSLVDGVLHYAKGLPLALVVLGSFLCRRGEHEWESTLQKLGKSPNKKINDVLKISYEALENYEKEIFLDIACFFKGCDTYNIKKILDSCDFPTTIGIQILIERSLISQEGRTLQMHDLIQLMGMDIAKEECRDDPGKRSRLWLYDDILDVLSRDVGANAIKAIVLKLREPKDMHIGPNSFANMRKLRLLILHNVQSSFQGPMYLPNELRWFEWPHCDSIPEFRAGPKKLVFLDLQNTNIEGVLKQFKDFEYLKFINMCECKSLVHMPDLSCTPNLKELILKGCKNLESVHDSIAYHGNLQSLDLRGCSKLQRLPQIPVKNKSLQKVDLGGTSIEELPPSIENLVYLNALTLNGCEKLAIIPSNIYKLQNLASLSLVHCSILIKFPKIEENSSDAHTNTGFQKLKILNLGGCNLSEVEFLKNLSSFPKLQFLSLWGNNFTNLPTLKKLYCLEMLSVSDCQQLQEIPKIPRKLRGLWAYGCKSLSRIPSDICGSKEISLGSCEEVIGNGFSVNDWLKLEKFHRQRKFKVVLPGAEMPKWLLPNKEGYISFQTSKDLYKKILGLAFCVIFQGEGRYVEFTFTTYVNGINESHPKLFPSRGLDHHLWFEYIESKDVWRVDDFGPNDWSHFHVSIGVSKNHSYRAIVKNCGFRLICKPIENDLKDNLLLDPALVYEVPHEDNLTSTEEESSREIKDQLDSETSTEKGGLNVVDFSIEKHRYSTLRSIYRNIRSGGEMPKKFVLVKDDTISFMASQDLYDKFIGLALCVVFGVEDGEKEVCFDIQPHVNGQRRNALSGFLGKFDSDHMWIQYLEPNWLWGLLEGAFDFGEFGESNLRFDLTVKVWGGTKKRLGYMLRCERLENDLKAMPKGNQLVDPPSLCEGSGIKEFPHENAAFEYDLRAYLRQYHIFLR